MTKGKAAGIYHKFNVSRTDGRDCPGGKHEGCHYFVLDLAHDKHAVPAIKAYAASCERDFPALASELLGSIDGKLLINAAFPAPASIPPLPADTFEEFARRKARDTRLADIGIPKRAVNALARAGYETVADIGKLTEASAPLTSVKGIGEEAAGEVVERIADEADRWVAEWNNAHPEGFEGDGEAGE